MLILLSVRTQNVLFCGHCVHWFYSCFLGTWEGLFKFLFPIPESIKSFGVWKAPALRMTSSLALTTYLTPGRTLKFWYTKNNKFMLRVFTAFQVLYEKKLDEISVLFVPLINLRKTKQNQNRKSIFLQSRGGGDLFLYRRLTFHSVAVENEPPKYLVPSYME